MITLLTGVPGTGKTAYAVRMLATDPDLKDRPIFSNITDLKLPHVPIDAAWLQEWHKNAPPGALIVFDECQDVFPPRHVSREAPDYIAELTKHRKDYSVDFFIITQKASLIAHDVRALVGRHLHIRKSLLGRAIHEAPEVVDFSLKTVREVYASKPYKLPKTAFGLYKSAEVHTKPPRRGLPTAAYVFGIAIVLAGVMGYRLFGSVDEKMAGSGEAVEDLSLGQQPDKMSGASQPVMVAAVPHDLREAMTPTDPHNYLSAPLYAAAAPSPVAPEVQGCIASKRACACYSQQQTPIWMPDEQCRQRAAGLYYDPYRKNPLPESQTEQAVAPSKGNEATAPEGGSSRAPEGPFPTITSRPPGGEALT